MITYQGYEFFIYKFLRRGLAWPRQLCSDPASR